MPPVASGAASCRPTRPSGLKAPRPSFQATRRAGKSRLPGPSQRSCLITQRPGPCTAWCEGGPSPPSLLSFPSGSDTRLCSVLWPLPFATPAAAGAALTQAPGARPSRPPDSEPRDAHSLSCPTRIHAGLALAGPLAGGATSLPSAGLPSFPMRPRSQRLFRKHQKPGLQRPINTVPAATWLPP